MDLSNPQYTENEKYLRNEFLVTNGIGGYSSSTISGASTRRYHGLLVAALTPPVNRKVLVSRIEEGVFLRRDTCIEFSTNFYPDAIHPKGFQYIKKFQCKPFPCWHISVGIASIFKTINMVENENTVLVGYKNIGISSFKLSLTPLFVYRDYHNLFHKADHFDFYLEQSGIALKVYAEYGAVPLYFSFSKGTFVEQRAWFYNFCYSHETERGLDDREDAYKIGKVECLLQPQEQLLLRFSTQAGTFPPKDSLLDESVLIKKANTTSSKTIEQFYQDLEKVADQFIVSRASTKGKSIIAGYHWFADWGRDTMIAMRGIAIVRGKQKIAQSIIRSFLSNLQDGLLPNNFPDIGEQPQYNSMDTNLWLFVVLWEYYQKFNDQKFITEVYSQLKNILSLLLQGTKFRIHVTEEGLLYGGEEGVQITWMDAKVDGKVITPRIGCPVEINALWYNALCIFEKFSKVLGKKQNAFGELKKQTKASFNQYFWNEEKECLYDVVIPEKQCDAAIRPNQLYALSLPFPLLNKDKAKQVLKIVKDKLLSPYGLRSLSSDDENFLGIYTGNQWQRDHAYHQGTVWTFLLGEYLLSYRYLNEDGHKTQKYIQKLMQPLIQHFYEENGLYCLSEIFDGLTPRQGKGCIQQAWSVGMLLQGLHGLFNTPNNNE